MQVAYKTCMPLSDDNKIIIPTAQIVYFFCKKFDFNG